MAKQQPDVDRGRGPGQDNLITLNVIVSGTPTEVRVNTNAPLHVAAKRALQQTGNEGRPLEDWDVKDEAGNLLDPDKKIEEYGLAEGATIFLSLKAGVGG